MIRTNCTVSNCSMDIVGYDIAEHEHEWLRHIKLWHKATYNKIVKEGYFSSTKMAETKAPAWFVGGAK